MLGERWFIIAVICGLDTWAGLHASCPEVGKGGLVKDGAPRRSKVEEDEMACGAEFIAAVGELSLTGGRVFEGD